MGQPSQNGPLTVQHFWSLLLDIMKAPFVVPTSIVTPSCFIAVALRLLDHALSYMSCTRATAALCSCAPAEKSRPPPTSLCAMCGRLRVGKGFLQVCSIGRCRRAGA